MDDQGALIGAAVCDVGLRVIGSVQALLVDPVSAAGRWLRLALADGRSAVVPVAAASADVAGRLLIPYDAATVAAAPPVGGAVVTEEEAAALLRHYGWDL